MPITLAKLFSPTARIAFPFLGDIVNVTWATQRYTGEMQDLFADLMADRDSGSAEVAHLKATIDEAQAELDGIDATDPTEAARIPDLMRTIANARDQQGTIELGVDQRYRKALRESLAKLVVSWDVLDDDGQVISTDEETLRGLPPAFLLMCFVSLSAENQPDPQKAPPSDEPSKQPPQATATAAAREISAPTPTGTTTSKPRGPSGSRHSSSTSEQSEPGGTPSGASGR